VPECIAKQIVASLFNFDSVGQNFDWQKQYPKGMWMGLSSELAEKKTATSCRDGLDFRASNWISKKKMKIFEVWVEGDPIIRDHLKRMFEYLHKVWKESSPDERIHKHWIVTHNYKLQGLYNILAPGRYKWAKEFNNASVTNPHFRIPIVENTPRCDLVVMMKSKRISDPTKDTIEPSLEMANKIVKKCKTIVLDQFLNGFFTESKLLDEFKDAVKQLSLPNVTLRVNDCNTKAFVLETFQLMRGPLMMQTECNNFSSILQKNYDVEIDRALQKIQNVKVMKSDRLGFLNGDKTKRRFINCVKLAMKQMHKNNAYTFWYYANRKSNKRRNQPTAPRARRLLAINYSSVIIMCCVVWLILVLCIVLVRHYRRRARIHGYVLKFVRNAKKSIRFVSEKHRLHNF